MKTTIIAEIGINHNGDINIAKQLIDGAVFCKADMVKFQKRTVDVVYTKEELDRYRESPWGTTNREQKYGLEFGEEDYNTINSYCIEKGIEWFASAWDVGSLEFLRKYNLKYNKVASAMITNIPFLEAVAEEKKYTFISTGMSTMEIIRKAVGIFTKNSCPFELLHCHGTYPMKPEDANLNMMKTLRDEFSVKVGYSGHESGLIVSCAAKTLGATTIERHITLDRTMYGSDQSSSMEIMGLYKLINYVRTIEKAFGTGEKTFDDAEIAVAKKLRYWEK